MKTRFTNWLLALVLLAGCTGPSASEKQALYEISEFLGGTVRITSGRNFSVNGSESQGHYLAVVLNSPGLDRHYPDLSMPASNCAYLVFNNLKPAERESYDFVKVAIQDSAGTHTYTFPQQQLKQASAAAENLHTLLFNIQGRDYVAAANNFNPDALGTMPRDSLPYLMQRIGTRLNPFTEHRIHGFVLTQVPVQGKPHQLIRLYISVPQGPESNHFLTVVIDPTLSEAEHFLYGLNFIK